MCISSLQEISQNTRAQFMMTLFISSVASNYNEKVAGILEGEYLMKYECGEPGPGSL